MTLSNYCGWLLVHPNPHLKQRQHQQLVLLLLPLLLQHPWRG
jgi:hypothetical protein